MNADERWRRARCSLEGLSVGDAFGERLYAQHRLFQADVRADPLAARPLPAGRWEYTDDTQMALSIAELLRREGRIDQDSLALAFGVRFEVWRGYGQAMRQLLPKLATGQGWREASAQLFGGRGSFGNGAAMRVAPLGAFFADDMDAVIEQATLSAQVTHAHPEGVAGAVAVAAAAALAWRQRGAAAAGGAALLGDLVPLVPPSEVREKIGLAVALPAGTPVWDAVRALGNGSGVTAQDTVPFALWCAAQHLGQYEDALWLAARGLGDVDTNCAIVGGVVACYTGCEGIPSPWLAQREPLPDWVGEGGD